MMHCYWFVTLLLWSMSISSLHGRTAVFRVSGWSTWETASSCSVTCGTGNVKRTRECIGNPKFCIGNKIDFRTCHDGCCAVTAGWCEWSSWSNCDYNRALGIGIQTRSRKCECPLAHDGGVSCEGDYFEEQACISNQVTAGWCEWSSWSDCDYSCLLGIGTQTRTRTCECPQAHDGGAYCEGNHFEEQQCFSNQIPCAGYENPGVFTVDKTLYKMENESEGDTAHIGLNNDYHGYEYPDDYPTIDDSEDYGNSLNFDNFDNLTNFDGEKPEDDQPYPNDRESYDYGNGDIKSEDDDYPEGGYDFTTNQEYYDNHDGSENLDDHESTQDAAIQTDCAGFYESMRDDPAKANVCCDMLRNFVANNDTLFESANHPKEDTDKDVKRDHTDNSTFISPQATNVSVAVDSISDLEYCLSRNLESPDSIVADPMSRSVGGSSCHIRRNRMILRTVCCVDRSCHSWKKDSIKGLCRSCWNEGRCYCAGVPLSG